jgi:ATP-binding cassette, subfamily C (CFTR/MRP), member 1
MLTLLSESGKSSLLLSLTRLIELDSGSIFIDNIDLSTLPRELIRTRLTAIPQDPFFLASTVRCNLDPTSTQTTASIIAALEKVQLWERIQASGGLEAPMKSQPLSQGESQLFCLARTLLRRRGGDQRSILLLDEPTSNVDAETEKLVQAVMRKEFAGDTIIMIAHRLDSIDDADMVAVLHEGRLMEFGPPKELLNRPSLFREMHED